MIESWVVKLREDGVLDSRNTEDIPGFSQAGRAPSQATSELGRDVDIEDDEASEISPTPKARPKLKRKTTTPIEVDVDNDNDDDDDSILLKSPVSKAKKKFTPARIAARPVAIGKRPQAPSVKASASSKRARNSDEGVAVKRAKTMTKKLGGDDSENDYLLIDPEVLRQPEAEEDIEWARSLEDQGVDFGDRVFGMCSRIRLRDVPGLVDKVRRRSQIRFEIVLMSC